jgi:hypothetical protein
MLPWTSKQIVEEREKIDEQEEEIQSETGISIIFVISFGNQRDRANGQEQSCQEQPGYHRQIRDHEHKGPHLALDKEHERGCHPCGCKRDQEPGYGRMVRLSGWILPHCGHR